MSRVGMLPITLPSGVEVVIDGQHITVKGPKGTLEHTVSEPLTIEREDEDTLVVQRPDDQQENRSLHGLTRSLVNNLVVGVTEGYEKTMEIYGVGYRVQAKGDDLEFTLGYSHPITVTAPEGITFKVETPARFSVSGIDKQKVGQTAAVIRKLRRADPYKGKGVRYEGERIRRKVGKTGK